MDPGVWVSLLISQRDSPAHEILNAAIDGSAFLLVSPLLIAELREVLLRDKFRRWFSVADANEFLGALQLLSVDVSDPSRDGWATWCRDENDEYLVALAVFHEVTMLVSGDKDLLAVTVPGLSVVNPRGAVDALAFRHPWGRAFVPGTSKAAFAQADVEGHGAVLRAVSLLLTALAEDDAAELLWIMVTPESLQAWIDGLGSAQELLLGRGMASRAEYPVRDVAYVKLPPDPGEHLRATGDVLLEGAVIVTLIRRPGLADPAQLDGWRVHVAGDYVSVEDLPPR